GLKEIEAALSSAICPRESGGARELAIRSYFPNEIIRSEPEQLASNLFKVLKFPEVVHRFYSSVALPEDNGPLTGQWAFRRVSDTHFLSFHSPPSELAVAHAIKNKGASMWNAIAEID